jgi:hypothetical protein
MYSYSTYLQCYMQGWFFDLRKGYNFDRSHTLRSVHSHPSLAGNQQFFMLLLRVAH